MVVPFIKCGGNERFYYGRLWYTLAIEGFNRDPLFFGVARPPAVVAGVTVQTVDTAGTLLRNRDAKTENTSDPKWRTRTNEFAHYCWFGSSHPEEQNWKGDGSLFSSFHSC
jgi:hypothetical protein